ncbi:hypothetical protein D7Y13_09840 [Corallococcus praedator]|uniref:Uncharacterized protein n=1 Tax=Corallococcus praedator TaxID=2316724 RepID=A0ABX9QM80_9BACT|nr:MULTISPECIES: hypothetical protein [Corallococcus]RKH18576.1 hypothetical protein D7X74_09250 [Corallococcus sp. CA047B]RKH26967.1 hypothetical protein D7X75_27395 [Corallococcus sp. CA031C]RKI12167.1 hypothetical protein D7Y13_09840 [Corallococcus praedator]
MLRDTLGWLVALQLLVALVWVGPLHPTRLPVSLDTLRTRARQAQVLFKAAATVRHHALPFVRLELESWWLRVSER